MPEPPSVPKIVRPLPTPHDSPVSVSGGYAELHCKTNFSFQEGASHPDELVQRAGELGYAALAVTDRNSLAGVVRAHVAAKAIGLKLLIGAEVTPVDAPPVVLLAMDRAGYGRLSTLITVGRRNAPKGECRLTLRNVLDHAAGLIACIVSRESRVGSPEPEKSDCLSTLDSQLSTLRDAFGDRAYLLAELFHGPDDRRELERLCMLSRDSGIPLVAANDVHYHVPDRQPLHDMLAAVRYHCTVAELGHRRFPNAERHLKSPEHMRALFATCTDAVERTLEIAGRCAFSLDELRYEYPRELCPDDRSPMAYLRDLTWQGAHNRYPTGIPDRIRGMIEHELKLIGELRYEAYFLTVWDLVRFARQREILCQGRGSAANSAVCFCLGVTSVDPTKIDLLFERFISKERNEPPDIDVDFEHERREEVLQYLYDKYGRDRAGMTATLITYRPKSAIRDVGKALGLSLDCVDKLAKNLDHYGGGEGLAVRFREAGLNLNTRLARQCLWLTKELLSFPRHLSQHVGGMVMTQGPLHELVPIENAAMPGRTVIEWDKDDLDALGLLKVDCLCLGMLSAIRKCFDLIEQNRLETRVERSESKADSTINHQPSTIHPSSPLSPQPLPLSLAAIPQDDPAVYEMIQRADTIGVFQIESRAQMSMLPRLKPDKFYDLVIEVAIVRPGPIQGDMVHPYLRRRRGEEPVEYPDDRIKAVLNKTLGVPLFQEQAMKLAQVAAGFTPGESDQLRRAMAAWKRKGGLEPFRQKLIDGMRANGYAEEFAERLYKQICGFGEYGFPESHAASFALLAYVSAWLKHYYPAAFCAALVNSQPMGFYAPAQLVADARRHGVDVRPADVNFSDWDCTLECVQSPELSVQSLNWQPSPLALDAPPSTLHSLRLGLRMIGGFRKTDADTIQTVRQRGPFVSVDDFQQRTGFGRGVMLKLSRADAFASMNLSRRGATWQALNPGSSAPLLHQIVDDEPAAVLPVMSASSEVAADYCTVGLSLRAHPFTFLREHIAGLKAVRAVDLEHIDNGKRVKVAGLVLLRQRPQTAKGVTFVTLEDETGQVNLVVWQQVWERFRRVARSAAALLVTGELQKADGIIHFVTRRMEDLTDKLPAIPIHSRDFR